MRANKAFTLVEAVTVLALLSAVFLITGNAFLNLLRISNREQALLKMDQDANRALESIKQVLRPAYIPIAEEPLTIGREGKVAATDFDDNVESWREVLENGADLLVFLVAVDSDNTGDTLYATSQSDKRLILGIETPESDSAEVSNGIWEATDKNDTLASLGILDLNPQTHLQLPANNSSSLDLSHSRFANAFVFPTPPGGRKQVYGVIRFKPYRNESGAITSFSEAALQVDLNDDGDETDAFVLGSMEIVYPNSQGGVITQSLSGNSVLLQTNRNDSPQNSIFQFWSTSSGGRAIKVNLLMFSSLEQQSPVAFGHEGYQLLTRNYETVVNMQLMSVR